MEEGAEGGGWKELEVERRREEEFRKEKERDMQKWVNAIEKIFQRKAEGKGNGLPSTLSGMIGMETLGIPLAVWLLLAEGLQVCVAVTVHKAFVAG